MGSVLRPVGQQPAAVYWRRRLLVLAVLLAIVAGAVWGFVSCAAGADGGAVEALTSPVASPTASSAGPAACNPANIDLSVVGFQRVKTTDKQVFQVTATNSGPHICVLEIKPAWLVLTVTSGNDRIWSTQDCDKNVESASATLLPGASWEGSVDWTMRRSSTGCKLAKSLLKAGTYSVAVKWQTSSAKQAFQIVEP
ncbi:MAG: hypothetical protein LBR32_10305 [Propionibacteriaceae bacterium]|jgi:hypothetical protein|nr:hypothetical protein [Propionibacteriaceae bacterium]